MENIRKDGFDLEELLDLFKKRNVGIIKSPEGRSIISRSNAALQEGVLRTLLGSIKDDIDSFRRILLDGAPIEQSNQLHLMRTKANIIFFAAYQSQLEENEVSNLVGVIKELSNMIAAAGNGQQDDQSTDWCAPIFSLMVVLQLTQIAALQQTTCLLSRHVDYTQTMYQQCSNIEEVIEVGNSLPQSPGSRSGMDAADWQCDGAKGLACLAYAVLRQPEVDVDHAPASDVEWFLHEACRLRAYSYIRLCVLPVIQAAYMQDRDTALFYAAVLCELLENLAKMFCMTHYKQLHAHNENDFPYVFFPPTGAFYSDNMAFYADRLSAAAGQTRAEPAAMVDSLEDVMTTYTAVLELRPEFAHVFWPSVQSHDIEVQQRRQQQMGQAAMAQTSEHHDIVDHYYHPFVMKAVDASFHHPQLIICAIRFVAALSASPLGRTAYAGYLFVLDSSHHHFGWAHFFDSMDSIALQLGASLAAPAKGPAGAAFGMTSYGLQQQQQAAQQQLVTQHHFSLSEKDAEGLVAIMRLICAVAVHPAVAALLHENFRPVPRLFALLSCSLPITLKGAILRALSVFARGSATLSEEIWQLVEAHRLLPISASPSTVQVGAGGRRASASARGVRAELEEAEARAGRYPVTEGFLLLLDALLSHGTPDQTLGLGYRRPGLMMYLDYVVEEVLLRCQDRSYQPADWSSALGQRWRITALCLQMLSTVLQNYHINAVPADSVLAAEQIVQALGASAEGAVLRDLVADFREHVVEYPVEGTAGPQRMSRPKSAGFVLMTLLLGRARLFDYLGYVLLECSMANMEESFNVHCVSEMNAAVDLIQRMFEVARPAAAAKKDTAFDFTFPAKRSGGVTLKGAPAVVAEEPLDLTAMGREQHLCDPVFWQERCVAAAVGIFYECALRERKFTALLRSSPAKITLTRLNEQGRVAVLPVVTHDLSELLCADKDSGMLALIAQVVPAHLRSCPCLPSANVLALRVLEHVALHLPASRLMAALLPATQQSAASEGASWFLVRGCADALKSDVSWAEEQNEGTLHYDIVAVGGSPYPALFSLSAAYTANPFPPNMYLTMVNADTNEEAAQVDAEYLRALRLGSTVREAVLSLLLRTLTPSTLSLSHQLLGLTARRSVSPDGCLQAVLYLLSPSSSPLGTTYLQQRPEQAVDCFELVYRLCASPVCSKAVLAHLGERSVDFMRAQITVLVYLMHLSEEELLEGTDPTTAGGNGLGGENGSAVGVNPAFVVAQQVRRALCTCSAWLLKICALFLRFAELDKASATRSSAQALLELLCSGCDALPFSAERGEPLSVLGKLLLVACSYPQEPGPGMQGLSSAAQTCVAAATSVQCSTKAGSGWAETNPFRRQDAAHADALSYSVVDLCGLSARISASSSQVPDQSELQGALTAALLHNIYNKAASANAHFCLAWCQLVNVITARGRTTLTLLHALGGGEEGTPALLNAATDRYAALEAVEVGGQAAARMLVDLVYEQLLIPTSGVLAKGCSLPAELARPVLESLSRCLLSQVSLCTSPLLEEGDVGPCTLLPDQFAGALDCVVPLLGQPSRDLGMQALPGFVSAAQRGTLAAALTVLLQVPARHVVGEGYAPPSSWSQENKDGSSGSGEGQLAVEYRKIAQDAVMQRAAELLEVLGRESASPSTGAGILWRLSCLGALHAVLASLLEEAVPTHMFVQSLQLLAGRGFLSSLISTAITSRPAEDGDALLLNVLGLCCQIACCEEGVEALLAAGLLERLVEMDQFANPPPFPDEIAYYGAAAAQSREAAVADLQRRYGAVAGLIRCLFAAAPASAVVAQGVAAFLRKNQVLVTQLLRLRYQSLDGLALTEATVAVLAMLAAVPSAGLTGQDPLWDLLGGTADSFLADSTALLGVIGANPLPTALVGQQAQSRAQAEQSWWDCIQPAEEAGERALSDTPCPAPVLSGAAAAGWTLFDNSKLRFSLQLLAHCVTFVRLATSLQRGERAKRAQQAVNSGALVEAFCQCAALGLRLDQGAGAAAGTQRASADPLGWLQTSLPAESEVDVGARAVAQELLQVAEGLACAIHNCAAAGTSKHLSEVGAQRVLKAAEGFPSHSFARQVARWIKDVL